MRREVSCPALLILPLRPVLTAALGLVAAWWWWRRYGQAKAAIPVGPKTEEPEAD